jgi:hypothetical protein
VQQLEQFYVLVVQGSAKLAELSAADFNLVDRVNRIVAERHEQYLAALRRDREGTLKLAEQIHQRARQAEVEDCIQTLDRLAKLNERLAAAFE